MERPQSHLTDTLGKAQLRRVFEPLGWTVNEVEHDYGIDFDIQLFENHRATGEWFKLQLKSSESTSYSADHVFISETIDRDHAAHFSSEMVDPVFVIHADVATGRTFWYAPQLELPVAPTDPRQSVTVRVPVRNELPATLPDLVSALRKIRIRLGARTVAGSPISEFLSSVEDDDPEKLIVGIQDKADALRVSEIHNLASSGNLDRAAEKIESVIASAQSSVRARFSAILERERIEFLSARRANAPQSTTSAIHLRTGKALRVLTRKSPGPFKFFAMIALKAAELDALTFRDLGLYMNLKSHRLSGDPATALHLAMISLKNTSNIVAKYNQCIRLVRYAANSPHRWALPNALTRIVESVMAFIARLRDEGQIDAAREYTASAFKICELAAWIAEHYKEDDALSHAAMTAMLLAYEKQSADEICKATNLAKQTLEKIQNSELKHITTEMLDRAARRMVGERVEGDRADDLVTQIIENRAAALGIDMTDASDPLVKTIRLGIADYSAERAIRHCEYAFVSISGWGIPGFVAMAADLLQLTSMFGKIEHCTLHDYNVEGRTLDTVTDQFKTKYCASCRDISPRPSDWKYSDEWLEEENKKREAFMSRFYDKRYRRKT
jgi:hypothetical protein